MDAAWESDQKHVVAVVPALFVAAVFFLLGAVLVFWGWHVLPGGARADRGGAGRAHRACASLRCWGPRTVFVALLLAVL